MFLRSSLKVLICIFFLNSCSSSPEENTTTSETPVEKSAPSLYVVQIEQMKFLPTDINLHKR